MRLGFAIFLVIAFGSMLAVAYAQQELTTTVGVDKAMKEEPKEEKTMKPLPETGGPAVEAFFLPAAALLVGSGVLAYAVLRRSQPREA
jgi:hypothetical protein